MQRLARLPDIKIHRRTPVLDSRHPNRRSSESSAGGRLAYAASVANASWTDPRLAIHIRRLMAANQAPLSGAMANVVNTR